MLDKKTQNIAQEDNKKELTNTETIAHKRRGFVRGMLAASGLLLGGGLINGVVVNTAIAQPTPPPPTTTRLPVNVPTLSVAGMAVLAAAMGGIAKNAQSKRSNQLSKKLEDEDSDG